MRLLTDRRFPTAMNGCAPALASHDDHRRVVADRRADRADVRERAAGNEG
jgi:hypothetical protein